MASRAQTPSAPRVDRRTRAARRDGRDGREAIFEAAAAVFAERGFAASSVEEIARRAGFSKGAVYWHFDGKDDLFFALIEDRVDRPLLEWAALAETAPPDQDMAPEASRRFTEILAAQRELVLLDHEFRSLAVRDARLRARYNRRQARLRRALGAALETRARHLGAPPLGTPAQDIATAYLSLINGLALESLLDPDAVPGDLLGEVGALIYQGLVARAGGTG